MWKLEPKNKEVTSTSCQQARKLSWAELEAEPQLPLVLPDVLSSLVQCSALTKGLI